MRSIVMKLMVSSLLMLASFQSSAAGFDFRVADKAAEVFYLYNSSTFGYGGSDIGWGYFFNENDDQMISGSLLVSGNGAGSKRALQFGVGVKAFLADFGNNVDVYGGGIGIGGLLRYVFSSSTPVAILLEAYAVPTITSIGDATDFSEARISFELEVSPSARAYVGYRTVTLETETNEYKLDEAAHFGVRISF